MNKLCRISLISIALIICLLSGCSGKGGNKNVKLTDAQKARIELIVQHRDEWKEVSEIAVSYPVNRLHISETSDGITILSVAHVREGTGSDKGWQTFVVNGFAANDTVFTKVNTYHDDWIADCISIDPDTMTDDELAQVLEESSIAFLSKE